MVYSWPLSLSLLAAAGAQHLKLDVTQDGSFTIKHNDKLWLSGREYVVGDAAASNGNLVLVDSQDVSGSDVFGKFKAKTLSWAHEDTTSEIVMKTSFRTYPADDGLIVFEQSFPSEIDASKLQAMSSSGLSGRTVFPAFDRPQHMGVAHPRDLPCAAYHGVFPKVKGCTLSTYKDSHQGGAPLLIYDDADKDLPMLVFSPLNFPKAQHMVSSPQFFGAGIKKTVNKIPEGWSQLFLLSAEAGINKGMMAWGDRMLKFTGKPRVNNLYRDDIHGSIGYWTDNGGYYHYSIGNNRSLGSNYEEVLSNVKAYHDDIGVPFKHWQLDSWFYPKDGSVSPDGGGGAVVNWTAMPSVFPSGMAGFQKKIGLPMALHNRQWSIHSDYIKRLSFEWYKSKKAAVPKDPAAFFDYFFTQQEGWGLSMYEQDWMCAEYDDVEALQTNISMGDLWLHGMAQGAEKSGRTVQYCMPYSHDILSAAAYPAVTNARATNDYHADDFQWAVGNTALYYWALGILPFKDGFYSSDVRQPGGQNLGPEKKPDRETLMATLSCAMVGPMDGIYLLNKTRVMTTCRSDGKLLKPDRPVTATDSCFRRRDPSCLVYSTHSDIEGLGRVHYYFNDAGGSDLHPEDVYLTSSDEDKHTVYNWYTGSLQKLNSKTNVEAGYEGTSYAMVLPVVHGWSLIGEVDKYVTISKLRFSSVQAAGEALHVSVRGVKGETVKVCAAEEADLKVKCRDVNFKADGIKHVSFSKTQQMNSVVV